MIARSQDGHVGLELALGAGLLVLPVALLVLTFPGWVERRSAAQVAAQEAARTAVVADVAAGTPSATRAVVAAIAENHGLEADELDVCLATHALGDPPPRCGGPLVLTRGGEVTAWVGVRVPVVRIPMLELVLAETRLEVRHTERIDRYRSFP